MRARGAKRLIGRGLVLTFIMAAMLAPAKPALADFSGCQLSPLSPCERVDSNHRMVYWVESSIINRTYFNMSGKATLWYQVPGGSEQTLWSSAYTQFPADSRVNYPRVYLNRAFPENTKLCTRAWEWLGGKYNNRGSSCAWIKY
jgi:hypothetical protein